MRLRARWILAMALLLVARPVHRSGADVARNETVREAARAETNVLVRDALDRDAAGLTAAQIADRLLTPIFAAQQTAERNVLDNLRAGDALMYASPLALGSLGLALDHYRKALLAAATQVPAQSKSTIPHVRYRLASGLCKRANTRPRGDALRQTDLAEAQRLFASILAEYPQAPEAPHALVAKGPIETDIVAPPVAAIDWSAARTRANDNYERLRLEYPEYHLWGENAITGTPHAGAATTADEVVYYLQNRSWAFTFGGADMEEPGSIALTLDDGFVVGGLTRSYGDSVDGDMWLVRLDRHGNVVWQKKYGGANRQNPLSMVGTPDGGFLLTGFNGAIANPGGGDVWVVKLRSDGSIEWQRAYGGTGNDFGAVLSVTSDGGCWVAAGCYSFGNVKADIWLLRLDPSGNVIRQQMFGGSEKENFPKIRTTPDDGCIVCANTESFDASLGLRDIWVLRFDANGSILWQKTYGGSGTENVAGVDLAPNGGFTIAGSTASYGAGGKDVWVLGLDADGNLTSQTAYGGTKDDEALSIVVPPEAGALIGGVTASFGAGSNDLLVLRFKPDGTLETQTAIGGTAPDNIEGSPAILATKDGGAIWGSSTSSFGIGTDYWILKLEPSLKCPPLGVTCTPRITVTTAVPKDTDVTVRTTTCTQSITNIKPEDTSCDIAQQAP